MAAEEEEEEYKLLSEGKFLMKSEKKEKKIFLSQYFDKIGLFIIKKC